MNYKLPKELKNRMLREIRQYEHNKKKLHSLRENNKVSTRQYIYLEERLLYIKNTYMRLKESEKKVYNFIFKEGCNWKYCQTMYNIDKDTYYNVYNKTLYFLAEEWGEI